MTETLDLDRLGHAHAKLPSVRAAELAECAALAFEARAHEPGVQLAIELVEHRETARIEWTPRGSASASMRDAHRITEDGADGVTLAVIGARRWKVLRRLQRGTYADWLVADDIGSERALEVAGTAEEEIASARRSA